MADIFWAMTIPTSNKRGYMIAYCVTKTRQACWERWINNPAHFNGEKAKLRRYGYKPRKVVVIPLDEARQSDEHVS